MPRRAKRVVFEWFQAAIRQLDKQAVLQPIRGCTRRVVELGEEIVEKTTNEPGRQLMVNVGDHLILCGPTVDEVQGAEVRWIEAKGYRVTLHVSLGYGGPIARSTTSVHLLKTRKSA